MTLPYRIALPCAVRCPDAQSPVLAVDMHLVSDRPIVPGDVAGSVRIQPGSAYQLAISVAVRSVDRTPDVYMAESDVFAAEDVGLGGGAYILPKMTQMLSARLEALIRSTVEGGNDGGL